MECSLTDRDFTLPFRSRTGRVTWYQGWSHGVLRHGVPSAKVSVLV